MRESAVTTQNTKVKVDTGMGVIWCIGWLFTIGFASLGFWQGVLAIFVWPYYLGVVFA